MIDVIERPCAPHYLNDEETEVWRGVVENHPADWFTSATVPLLAAYCRHTINAQRIAEMIECATSKIDKRTRMPNIDLEDYDRLLKMAARESTTLAQLATKMRIAQQSTVTSVQQNARIGKKRDWQTRSVSGDRK